MDILGVKIDNLSQKEILEKIENFLNEPRFHQIATVNPEFVLGAQKNKEFKNILNSCDLNVADGFGIKCAFWRYGKKLKSRIAGADLMLEILRLANEKKLSVFLACRRDGLSLWKEARDAILKLYPDLNMEGENIDVLLGTECLLRHSVPSSPILLCNFGAPHQELFINGIKSDTIRLAMGVGGSFDFLTGKVRRAPVFMRHLGLEWLWRLVLQPRRIKRILNAVIIFPVKVILCKEK